MPELAYLAVPDNLVCVAQTPSVPGLGEASDNRATPLPFVVVSDGAETWLHNPDPCAAPDDRFLVETNVIARNFSGVNVQPRFNQDTATQFKCAWVKILVSSCDGESRRIIDPGFPIVVRGPKVRVAVLAPATSADLTRNATTTLIGGTAQLEESFEVKIFASACPLRCYSPPLPQLTYFRAHDAVPAVIDCTFVVPRGASRLVLGDLDAAVTRVEFWQGDPNTAASRQLGQQGVVAAPAAPLDIPVFGSPTHILFRAQPNNAGFFYMRWEID